MYCASIFIEVLLRVSQTPCVLCVCVCQDGSELNVGNPLAKGYLHQMETGTLTSAAGRLGQRILTLNSTISFWRSARQRIL